MIKVINNTRKSIIIGKLDNYCAGGNRCKNNPFWDMKYLDFELVAMNGIHFVGVSSLDNNLKVTTDGSSKKFAQKNLKNQCIVKLDCGGLCTVGIITKIYQYTPAP